MWLMTRNCPLIINSTCIAIFLNEFELISIQLKNTFSHKRKWNYRVWTLLFLHILSAFNHKGLDSKF